MDRLLFDGVVFNGCRIGIAVSPRVRIDLTIPVKIYKTILITTIETATYPTITL